MKTDYAAHDTMAGLADGPGNTEEIEFQIEELESRIAFENVEGGCCSGPGVGCSCGRECTGFAGI